LSANRVEITALHYVLFGLSKLHMRVVAVFEDAGFSGAKGRNILQSLTEVPSKVETQSCRSLAKPHDSEHQRSCYDAMFTGAESPGSIRFSRSWVRSPKAGETAEDIYEILCHCVLLPFGGRESGLCNRRRRPGRH
jgi:hypothetical protein